MNRLSKSRLIVLSRWPLAVASVFMLVGCGDKEPPVRRYQEVLIGAPVPSPPSAPAAGELAWETPEGWSEQAGSGMRLATFTMGGADAAGECTIVSLGGSAGSVEANIKRWLGQLNIQPPEEAIATFAAGLPSIKTRGPYQGVVINLKPFVGKAGHSDASMLVSILTSNNRTVFVKLTGPVTFLDQERDHFLNLCRSIR